MLRALSPPLMDSTLEFQLAVHSVLQRDDRYSAQAYAFLCDALPFTVKLLNRQDADDRHVTGQELLEGFRALSLREFGPMALFVLKEWGITCSEDVGNMVYNLIEVKFFGKNDTDSINDFSDGVCLTEALTSPFRVTKSKP